VTRGIGRCGEERPSNVTVSPARSTVDCLAFPGSPEWERIAPESMVRLDCSEAGIHDGPPGRIRASRARARVPIIKVGPQVWLGCGLLGEGELAGVELHAGVRRGSRIPGSARERSAARRFAARKSPQDGVIFKPDGSDYKPARPRLDRAGARNIRRGTPNRADIQASRVIVGQRVERLQPAAGPRVSAIAIARLIATQRGNRDWRRSAS